MPRLLADCPGCGTPIYDIEGQTNCPKCEAVLPEWFSRITPEATKKKSTRDTEGKRASWLTNGTERRSLLEIALDVHMTATGALERACGGGAQERDIAYLKQKLSAWSQTIFPRSRRFDAAVAELIKAALAETGIEQ